MVVAGDEETRVLLRGLLRLHHYRIVAEAEGTTAALDALATSHPEIVVVDRQLVDGSGDALALEIGRRHPGLSVVLVVGGAPVSGGHAPAGAIVLRRPFRLQEFASALTQARRQP